MASSRLSIVVVEDHDDLREQLVELLAQHGHMVKGLSCAEAIDDECGGEPIDLLIVDLNLPGEDGLSLAQRFRVAQPEAGIFMTTARNQLADRVAGYERGADIYFSKPVAPVELLAAVDALARRLESALFNTPVASVILTLDTGDLILRGPLGDISVTNDESLILAALARAASHRLETWQLLQLLERANKDITKANLEIRLVRLRKKLAQAGAAGVTLRSLRNQGYQLCLPIRVH